MTPRQWTDASLAREFRSLDAGGSQGDERGDISAMTAARRAAELLERRWWLLETRYEELVRLLPPGLQQSWAASLVARNRRAGAFRAVGVSDAFMTSNALCAMFAAAIPRAAGPGLGMADFSQMHELALAAGRPSLFDVDRLAGTEANALRVFLSLAPPTPPVATTDKHTLDGPAGAKAYAREHMQRLVLLCGLRLAPVLTSSVQAIPPAKTLRLMSAPPTASDARTSGERESAARRLAAGGGDSLRRWVQVSAALFSRHKMALLQQLLQLLVDELFWLISAGELLAPEGADARGALAPQRRLLYLLPVAYVQAMQSILTLLHQLRLPLFPPDRYAQTEQRAARVAVELLSDSNVINPAIKESMLAAVSILHASNPASLVAAEADLQRLPAPPAPPREPHQDDPGPPDSSQRCSEDAASPEATSAMAPESGGTRATQGREADGEQRQVQMGDERGCGRVAAGLLQGLLGSHWIATTTLAVKCLGLSPSLAHLEPHRLFPAATDAVRAGCGCWGESGWTSSLRSAGQAGRDASSRGAPAAGSSKPLVRTHSPASPGAEAGSSLALGELLGQSMRHPCLAAHVDAALDRLVTNLNWAVGQLSSYVSKVRDDAEARVRPSAAGGDGLSGGLQAAQRKRRCRAMLDVSIQLLLLVEALSRHVRPRLVASNQVLGWGEGGGGGSALTKQSAQMRKRVSCLRTRSMCVRP